MNLKRQIPALIMASGLALVGAACEVEEGVEDPGVTDPMAPEGDDGLGDDGLGDDGLDG